MIVDNNVSLIYSSAVIVDKNVSLIYSSAVIVIIMCP